MARKKTVKKKIVDTLPPAPEEKTPEKQQPPPRFLIIAGLAADGNFIFDIKGSEQTLTNMLGVRDFLNARIDIEREKKLGSGDALTHEIGKLIIALNQKVDRLLSLLEPPANQL